MTLTKESSYEEVKVFMNSLAKSSSYSKIKSLGYDLNYDPSGSFCFYREDVENDNQFEVYATPNWQVDGFYIFECHFNEEEINSFEKEIPFSELTHEDYIENVITVLKDFNNLNSRT